MIPRPESDHYTPKGRGPEPRYGAPYHDSMGYRERGFRDGLPPHMRGHRGGFQNYRPPLNRGSEFDKPERPGFYAGSRQFRMDKMRHEPLERDERPGPSAKEFRDQRNRPAQMDRR